MAQLSREGMTEDPQGALLPRQNARSEPLWHFAAIVASAAAIGELLIHPLVPHLAGWLTHAISIGALTMLSVLLFAWSQRRRTERAALEVGAEHLLSAEIDNRRRTEHMLQERTELLDTLIQTSPVGIIVHDHYRVVTMANPAFCEIFDYTDQECVGRRLEELIVQPEAEAAFLTNIQRIADGAVFDGSMKRKQKDGILVDVEVHAKRLLAERKILRGVRLIPGHHQARGGRNCAAGKRRSVPYALRGCSVGVFRTMKTASGSIPTIG